ncbi:MAG: bifunctional oligoribonuclease/PAP phosphatase NrnA [Desulfobacteraceae bacterium]|nr:bifunctional oligoribonuclease/PAP phosphatase NrnA [Desulfobacteraceae bacterium]
MSKPQTGKIREIISAIRDNERFMVATHVRPDGDAIGALLGMRLILRRLGKHVDIYSQDRFPPEFEYLPGASEVRSRPAPSAGYDVAIFVDCGDFERVGEDLADFIGSRVPFLINIDHHCLNQPFGSIYWIETAASSTCEMLFDLCVHLSLAPDADLASLLYVGILTDTGSFHFSNTNRRVFEVASALVEAGADPAFISKQVYDSATPEKLNLLARVLGTVEFHAGSRIATAELTRHMLSVTSATYMDSEGFINHLRSVKTVDLAVLFREGSDGLIHVSLRSKEGIDVARFAQRHGGGGHKQAAACRIAGDLKTVRAMVLNEAIAYMG